MMSKIKMMLTTACAVMLLVTSSGCVSFSSVSEGLGAVQTNTTVDEAVADATEIEYAIKDAQVMIEQGDDSVYGEDVHTDSVCFGNVVKENDLTEQAKTKKIDGVSYKLYWDSSTHSAFWSSDGKDDIRNNEQRVEDIVHSGAVQLKTKTNITSLN